MQKQQRISIISSTNESVIESDLFSLVKQLSIQQPIEIIDFNLTRLENHIGGNEIIVVSNEYPYVNTIKCKYCGKCIEYCRVNAISFYREMPSVNIDKSICKSCFECERKCNITAIKRKTLEIGNIIKIKITDQVTYYYSTSNKSEYYHSSIHKKMLQHITDSTYQIFIFNKINAFTVKLLTMSDKIILMDNGLSSIELNYIIENFNIYSNKIIDLRNSGNKKEEIKDIFKK